MDIFTKIKNWLIKKLGGYTEEEIADVFSDAKEPWFELAKEYHNKYTAEHEAYLALLNCHNATAEATHSNTQGVSGAIDTIKAYCNGKDGCDSCALYNENSGCKVHEIPCYWGMSE